MKKVKKVSTLDKLLSKNPVSRFYGIIECFDRNYATQEEIEAMMDSKNDDFLIAGRKVDAWARAVLDLLGAEKYMGTDQDTINLIHDLPDGRQPPEE